MAMTRGYFNWKLAIVLVLAVVLVAATAIGLRRYNRTARSEAAYKAGQAAYEKEQWDDAAIQLGRCMSTHPDDISVLLKYADAQLRRRPSKQSNVQQAISAYREVLRLDKANADGARQLIQVYLAVGAPGEANSISDRFLKDNPGPHPYIRLMRGASLAALGNFAAAQTEWQAVIDANAAQVEAYDALGRLAEERPGDAVHPAKYWFDLAVEKNPGSAMARLLRVDYRIRTLGSAKAVADPDVTADLNAADELKPAGAAERIGLARLWLAVGAEDKARAHLDGLVQADGKDPAVWAVWAEWAVRSKSSQTMQDVAQKGLDALGDRSSSFLNTAAELFLMAGQTDRAAQCVAKMKETDTLPPVASYLDGAIYYQRGDLSKAIQCWQRAMSQGYANLAKSPQIRLSLADAYAQRGDTYSARAQLESACSEYPNSPACALAMARFLVRTRDWVNANRYAQAAVRALPDNVEARLIDAESQIGALVGQAVAPADSRWGAVDRTLADLEGRMTQGNSPRFLRVRLALAKGDVEGAKGLLAGIVPADQEKLRLALTMAECLVAQRKMQEAIQTLEGAVAQFPNASEPVRTLGAILLNQGDRARCETVLKEGLGRITSATGQMDLGLLLCGAYDQWARTDDAIALLEEMAKKQPDVLWIKRRLLDYPKIISNTSKAQALVDQIKEAEQKVEGEGGWVGRFEQARVWFAVQSPEAFNRNRLQIVDLLKKNLAANPNDQASRKLLGAVYERAGDMQVAITTYREALDRSPNDLAMIVRMVAALYKTKEYKKADEILQQAASRRLVDPALQELQLASYVQQGELGQASDYVQQIWSRDPNNPRIGLTLATLKLRQGQLDEAAQLLADGRRLDPNSVAIASAQVQLYLQQKKPAEAMQVCNDLLARVHEAGSYLLRGRLQAALGQKDAAREDFTTATTLEPRNAQVWMARSDFYRADGRLPEATADIDRALSLEPDNVEFQKQAIPLLFRSSDPERLAKGEAMLESALQARPNDVDLLLFKIRQLMSGRQASSDAEAERLLQSVTSNWPKTRDAWILWGELLLSQADAPKALETARRGLVNNPDDRSLMLLRARAEVAISPALAIPTLESLRKGSDPNDAASLVLLANAYLGNGQPDVAAARMRAFLPTCRPSDRLQCQGILVSALYRKGDKEQSRALLAEMAQASPDDPTVLSSQAWVMGQDGRWDDLAVHLVQWAKGHPKDIDAAARIAGGLGTIPDPQGVRVSVQVLRELVAQQPDSMLALQLLAQILQTSDRVQEAVDLYRKMIELDRKNVTAMNNMAWLLSERLDKAQDALVLANRGLEIDPRYLDLLDTRGVIHCRLGRIDKAVEDLKRCVDSYPKGNPALVGSYFHLAKAYKLLDRKAEASSALNEALDRQTSLGGLSAEELTEAQQLKDQLGR